MTKRKIITAVIAVILILAAGAYKLYLQGEEAKILTGTVEATKADVTPRLGGYLRERRKRGRQRNCRADNCQA